MKRILNAFTIVILLEAILFLLGFYLWDIDLMSLAAACMSATAVCCVILLEELKMKKEKP